VLLLMGSATACSDRAAGPDASAAASGTPAAPTSAKPVSDKDFDPGAFHPGTTVDNPLFPLVPGTRKVWSGHALDEGNPIRRRVVFMVTDLTKVIDGVPSVVVYELDYTNGELEESELAFFAQDDEGNVWQMGEYPEEYEEGELSKAPAWIAGLHGARPGVMMMAAPRTGTPSYAEGWGPEVGWNDRGKVDGTNEHTCVPMACYSDVAVVAEFNPNEPGAFQLKYYAPEVGGVRVGWRGPNEEEQEILVLTNHDVLDADGLVRLRRRVLAQDARGYDVNPDVYGQTPPLS
jgi:hypothetical protein